MPVVYEKNWCKDKKLVRFAENESCIFACCVSFIKHSVAPYCCLV